MPKDNTSSIGRKISFRNVIQMLINILIGIAVHGISFKMRMKLNQARNTEKAPICHCQLGAHQQSFPNPETKMMVSKYKDN